MTSHPRVNSKDVGVHESNARAVLGICEFAVANRAVAYRDFGETWSFSHDEGRRWSDSKKGPVGLVGYLNRPRAITTIFLEDWVALKRAVWVDGIKPPRLFGLTPGLVRAEFQSRSR